MSQAGHKHMARALGPELYPRQQQPGSNIAQNNFQHKLGVTSPSMIKNLPVFARPCCEYRTSWFEAWRGYLVETGRLEGDISPSYPPHSTVTYELPPPS